MARQMFNTTLDQTCCTVFGQVLASGIGRQGGTRCHLSAAARLPHAALEVSVRMQVGPWGEDVQAG